jgi:phosphate:Na+ symporter
VENIHILMAAVTAVILFVFGLENFSREIEKISGEKFRKSLGSATRIPVIGVLIGALVTGLIQSSSATSVITIGLVNAGVLSFKNSVGIIFGSNIGTTITAQLVAFKLTAFAPVIIIMGFALSLIKSRYSVFGKAIFYFGFVFFSLNLISATLQPLQYNESFVELLTRPQNPLLAILVGCLFTALVQSSSVTTGLAIIFTQQGLLGLENAVPLIMGANIGTTATALIAMFNMDLAAKKTAFSHFLFNVGGVVLFLPVFLLFGDRLNGIDTNPAVALAVLHLVFNLGTSLIFIVLINPFTRLVDTLLGEGKMDFQRLEIPSFQPDMPFEAVRDGLNRNLAGLLAFLQENYNLVTLSIESNYRSVFDASAKRIEYAAFIEREYVGYFSKVVASVKDEDDSRELLRCVARYDYLFQIHDSIDDIFNTKRMMNKHYIELKSDIMLMVRELSSQTLSLFDDIGKAMASNRAPDIVAQSVRLQVLLNDANRELLTLLADPERRDAGALSNFVTYSRRLKDKLVNFAALVTPVPDPAPRGRQPDETADVAAN